ncbi:ATP/GTP-binding protein [Embleya sp. NPDC059237]|uniref:ATP/GTP-binding protein n=1 Tax=Embleya sp. NPDC059237 TaxID=3346784 RepID=UPI00367459C6
MFATNEPGLDTDEAFVNRQEQWSLVGAALAEHLRVTADVDVEDLEAPRNNLIVFHGVGGVGKSTLSRKVEASLPGHKRRPAQWGEPPWTPDAGDQLLPIRIDLARSAGTDFEHVLLTIRLALADKVNRPLPAFDIALRRYWEHAHPGEPLEEYLQRRGLAGRAARTLPQQMQAALSEVAQALLLPGAVGSAIGQVTTSLVRALRERRRTVRALAGCRRLADLLEAEPDPDTLSFFPHLLAWELARFPADERVTPVILFDTWEEIGDRTHRDLERLLQRVVWLMPTAFFVITGRSRLQWADHALQGQLDHTGPAAWPGLATHDTRTSTNEPHGRQILIGDLSPEDCNDHLARRLSRDGQPLIDSTLRGVITARSHGLPLYLDLAVMRFLEIRRNGGHPQPEDFSHDFAALVARTLSDLTPDERHVLRAVTLLDAFDLSLATRTAGMTHQAPAQRLIERPFVREDPLALRPYHVHSLIRSTLRTADDRTDDRWSSQDWKAAAERALEALGDQWAAGPAHDRPLLVDCLRQGLRLAADFVLDLGWLAEAAWRYVGDSVWEPLAPPPGLPSARGQSLGTPADALIELLNTLARRQHEHRERTADRLAAVATGGLLPTDLHEMTIYYLAKAQRDLGRSAASRQGMERVANGGSRLAPAARRGLAHLARLSGDFPTALATASALGWNGRHRRVEGDVRWIQGDMNAAAAAYEAARTEAEQHGVAGERATAQAQRAFVLAFTDPVLADDELVLARQLLAGLDLRATTLTTRIAALVRDAGTAADIEDHALRLRTEIGIAGLASAHPTLELAVCFHYAVLADLPRVTASIRRLDDLARNGSHTYYADIAYYMADLPLPAPSSAQWIDGEIQTRNRWRALVTDRQAHVIPR